MPRLYRPIEVDAATISRIRHRVWLTQAQFAAALGVTRRTVIRWEKDGAKFDRYAIGVPHWRTGEASPFDRLKPLARKAGVKLPRVDP